MAFNHRQGGLLNCDDLNVTGGNIKRDGNLIQNVVDGVRTGSMNLAVVPYWLNWNEVGYVDIPYAGSWKLCGAVRFNYDCTDALLVMSWHTASAAQGDDSNCKSFYCGNTGNVYVYFSPEGIVSTTGPTRIYLNASVGHVSGGSPTFTISGGRVRAFRIV